jgi:predicted ribosomally synthesized peptide with nif11-like leader
MSQESATQFFQKAAQDPALREQLKSAASVEVIANKVAELGKAKGFDFTASEVEESIKPILKSLGDRTPGVLQSMSDEELEEVGGGITPTITVLTTLTTIRTSRAACD